MTDLRKAAIELLKSAPDHITEHWPELDEVCKALAQPEQTKTHNLVHEIDLVLTDPDTSLSVGAQRALRYVNKQLQVTAPPSKQKQEPVAWVKEGMVRVGFGRIEERKYVQFDQTLPVGTKLYTTPLIKPWVSLTDGEAYQLLVDYCDDDLGLLNAIEAALRSKNNG